MQVYNDSKEMDELDEDDKVKYEAQLECIASFSMKVSIITFTIDLKSYFILPG